MVSPFEFRPSWLVPARLSLARSSSQIQPIAPALSRSLAVPRNLPLPRQSFEGCFTGSIAWERGGSRRRSEDDCGGVKRKHGRSRREGRRKQSDGGRIEEEFEKRTTHLAPASPRRQTCRSLPRGSRPERPGRPCRRTRRPPARARSGGEAARPSWRVGRRWRRSPPLASFYLAAAFRGHRGPSSGLPRGPFPSRGGRSSL